MARVVHEFPFIVDDHRGSFIRRVREPFGCSRRAGVTGVRECGPSAAHFLRQRLQLRTVANLLGLFHDVVEHERKINVVSKTMFSRSVMRSSSQTIRIRALSEIFSFKLVEGLILLLAPWVCVVGPMVDCLSFVLDIELLLSARSPVDH